MEDLVKPIRKKCKHCNSEFITIRTDKIFCSPKCLSNYYKELNKTGYYDKNRKNYVKLRFEIFKRDNFQCQYCGRSPSKHGCVLNIDHKIPISKGGNDLIENLTTACEDCNQGKADRLLTLNYLKRQNVS